MDWARVIRYALRAALFAAVAFLGWVFLGASSAQAADALPLGGTLPATTTTATTAVQSVASPVAETTAKTIEGFTAPTVSTVAKTVVPVTKAVSKTQVAGTVTGVTKTITGTATGAVKTVTSAVKPVVQTAAPVVAPTPVVAPVSTLTTPTVGIADLPPGPPAASPFAAKVVQAETLLADPHTPSAISGPAATRALSRPVQTLAVAGHAAPWSFGTASSSLPAQPAQPGAPLAWASSATGLALSSSTGLGGVPAMLGLAFFIVLAALRVPFPRSWGIPPVIAARPAVSPD